MNYKKFFRNSCKFIDNVGYDDKTLLCCIKPLYKGDYEVDALVSPIIIFLHTIGVTTLASCCGHGGGDGGYIWVKDFYFDIPQRLGKLQKICYQSDIDEKSTLRWKTGNIEETRNKMKLILKTLIKAYGNIM